MTEVPQLDVLVVNKGGRDFRALRLADGLETPREFFYGYYALEQAGLKSAMMSSTDPVAGPLSGAATLAERTFASLTRLGARPAYVRRRLTELSQAKVVMSFTDGFSLSLGLGFPRNSERPVLMGGFHGLSDVEEAAAPVVRPLVRATIRRALAGLDHVFFFGAVDREVCIRRYGLERAKSSVIPFGVDEDFWRPLDQVTPADFAVAVGQDPNRDYDLLAAAAGANPVRIVTRRAVNIPPGATNVSMTVGDFFSSASMSDEDIRLLYNMAYAVVVPVKDINQPSGYSVSLQAMSCGRPVIISKIRGLWASDVIQDGVNCLLVAPGDSEALGNAISRIRSDRALGDRLGRAARETVVRHLGLRKIDDGTVHLARLGLSMYGKSEAVRAR